LSAVIVSAKQLLKAHWCQWKDGPRNCVNIQRHVGFNYVWNL